MRKILLVLGLALSTGAFATSPSVQSQLDDLKDGLHQVHMNTLQKYSESWGLEDRSNIAKLQETKLDKTVFSVDQERQDKALATTVTKQATRDAGQDQHINAVQDAAQSANIKADTLAVRADGIETNLGNVQTAAQIANEKADGLAVRADTADKAHAVTDNRSINNAVRLDGVEQVNDQQSVAISTETDSRIAGDSYTNSRVDAANAYIEANHQASVATNKRVAEHTAELANHEQRITGLEQQTNKAFADMKGRIDRVENRANAGTSAALSAAAIPQVTEYQTFALGAGVGGYEGESALAVGFSSRVSSAVVIKAAVTTDSQHGVGYNAGLSVGW